MKRLADRQTSRQAKWSGVLAAGIALLLCAGGASAQMYKWVDAKGVTHFGDRPPPASKTKPREVKARADADDNSAPLPYAVAEAARNSPVTLYTMTGCDSCDQGRQLLRQRGVPFVEKTVSSNEDLAKLKEVNNDASLPLLVVGQRKVVGFQAAGWGEALNDAAYPANAVLPAGYKNGRLEQASPSKGAVAERPLARQTTPAVKPPVAPKTDGAPPGFQF